MGREHRIEPLERALIYDFGFAEVKTIVLKRRLGRTHYILRRKRDISIYLTLIERYRDVNAKDTRE
jgi:hypothetical protein